MTRKTAEDLSFSGISDTAIPFQPEHSLSSLSTRWKRTGNLLLNLSIGKRLSLGFLLAALIAALVAGIVGAQRASFFSQQSEFYQHLLRTNTALSTGTNFLQLMDTEADRLLSTAAAENPSKETLEESQKALSGLIDRYDQTLKDYTQNDLLKKHPPYSELLAKAGRQQQVEQQATLAGSALRTWQVYRASLQQIQQQVAAGNIAEAQTIAHVQAGLTRTDALSALRALISLDQRLASAVKEAAEGEERTQLMITIIASLLAFLAIGLVGWFISGTLVRRLRLLRQVTQAIEQGHFTARVPVVGHDEISDVSASFNGMLEVIVGLLEETKQQRDALTNAAEHLFSEMRIVSSGDLRVNAPVSSDPIGMLANAFNFTVSRFRRFIARTQGAMEQVETIARREHERADAFAHMLALQNSKQLRSGQWSKYTDDSAERNVMELQKQLKQIQGYLHSISFEGLHQRARSLQALTEQISLYVKRLGKTTGEISTSRPVAFQELHILDSLLQRMNGELQKEQKSMLHHLDTLQTELSRLDNSLQTLKLGSGNEALPRNARELPAEVLKQGTSFTAEIQALAQQLNSLSQDMRTAITSFQLDGVEAVRTAQNIPGLEQALPPHHYSMLQS